MYLLLQPLNTHYTCLPPHLPAHSLPRSAGMQREVDTFVDRFRSIPAFTANLTLEHFQKQTQC